MWIYDVKSLNIDSLIKITRKTTCDKKAKIFFLLCIPFKISTMIRNSNICNCYTKCYYSLHNYSNYAICIIFCSNNKQTQIKIISKVNFITSQTFIKRALQKNSTVIF